MKQVIIIRKDLGMRRGKEIAQGSHASMSFLTKRLQKSFGCKISTKTTYPHELYLSQEEMDWLSGGFKKICVKVNSVQELFDLHALAKQAGLESHLIIDNGLTEFNHVYTPTCLAIGPDEEEKIDKITGNLGLY